MATLGGGVETWNRVLGASGRRGKFYFSSLVLVTWVDLVVKLHPTACAFMTSVPFCMSVTRQQRAYEYRIRTYHLVPLTAILLA